MTKLSKRGQHRSAARPASSRQKVTIVRPALLSALLAVSACQNPEQKEGLYANESFTKSHIDCKMLWVGEIPVHESQGQLHINATVNDQPVSLVFDTGTSETTLTEATVARLNLERLNSEHGTMIGIGGTRNIDAYDVHFKFKGIKADWQRVVLAGNLGPNTTDFGDGVIGTDFFRRMDIDLDLPAHKIVLYFPQHDCSSPSAFLDAPIIAVPLVHPDHTTLDTAPADTQRMAAFYGDILDRSPNITVAIGDNPLVATVDTGAPDNVLFLSGAKKIGLSWDQIKHDHPFPSYGIGPNPVQSVRKIIPALDVGNLEIRNVPVTIIDQDFPNSGDMLLGLDFIKRVHLWISYSSGSLILQYPPTPSPPFNIPRPTQPPT